ncbi:hypothetical protein NQ314_001710 [Rhamnusium bicolor]|uniref:HTH psq-type domain-containing protein n=1 Tax=Rhamnusium bicolor TaxID=1586634 RepID=A0AAV8ZUD6_9CUCU|nr:hypothetical protein NQ314_001710 [Rhamnusium bicolor]
MRSCHLATLLKTAEELRIKGLAEVSWRDEEQQPGNSDSNSNGVQTAIPQVQAVMDSPTTKFDSPSNKRKRGRPPIDDYDQTFTTPKIMNVTGGAQEDAYSNDAMSSSEHDLNIWEEDQSANEATENTENEEPPVKVKKELMSQEEDVIGTQSFLTPALEKEWPDVIKMNDYLNTGRRQQFWEEPFTKRVMDAIKTKNLEMKVAAELLGVSYGTLYGRYRDSYGCLKHPYRKEITLFRAAEQLNVTPQTLSNYLISMSQLDTPDANSSRQSNAGELYDDVETDDDTDSILPDIPSNNTNVFKNLVATTANTTSTSGSNSVLANCPDITIIKKEKPEAKVNNNSDHSESNSDQGK